MLDKTYFKQIGRKIIDSDTYRHQIIKLSSDILHNSKKAIFAMHRDNFKQADECLSAASSLINEVKNKFQKTYPLLLAEGSYKSGLEEFVEASLFRVFFQGKKIGKITGLDITPSVYVSGLCDVPGELLRYAVKSATEKNYKEVERAYKTAEDILGELIEMNLTGYNRQKFDQSKQALHKLEKIRYETSLRTN